MEESEEHHGSKECSAKTRAFKGINNSPHKHHYYQHHHPWLQYSGHYGFFNQNQFQSYSYYPSLLPLPPPIPLQLALPPPLSQNHTFQPKTHLQQLSISNTKFPVSSMTPAQEGLQWRKSLPSKASDGIKMRNATKEALVVARRPDSGGVEGPVISLLANHFLVKFDPSLKVYHYNVEISPNPSKEVARMIKQKLVESNSGLLCGAHPAYDGRKNFYSPVEFQNGKLEFFVSLPIPTANTGSPFGEWNGFQQKQNQLKVFRINIRAVSKFDGKDLSSYLSNESDDWIPLPQDYLHALDVVLRENTRTIAQTLRVDVLHSFIFSSGGSTNIEAKMLSGLRSNTTQSGQTSTANSSVKLKSPNRKRQTGGDPVSTQESVAN
ncbi:hypothetical protein GOBAR_AA14947 [Gossypium barbadense]|uniref:Protein argonaute N-terminal domain-containing protein n=1 Tax=Gossypium barbadense TaxID=3634 RepID=A0A2P5XQT2_GOSBA|nr:hypothetical protein GOBAR_AA14947 [Gossypium barbadense]